MRMELEDWWLPITALTLSIIFTIGLCNQYPQLC